METAKIHPFLGNLRIYVDPRFDMENHIVQQGMWEPHVVAAIQYLVEPGFVCVDVGANAGYHSLAMAQRGGEVLAFEPDSQNFARLSRNLELNPEVATRIRSINEGLSDEPGTLKVFRAGDQEHRGNAYLAESADPHKWTNTACGEPEVCRVTTLDDVLRGGQLDFMKIDVEGMEIKVLKGARAALERCHPNIIFESLMTEVDGPKSLVVQEFLDSLGYHLFYVDLKSFLLRPTRYPALKHDTVAIHGSKLARYRQCMDLRAP